MYWRVARTLLASVVALLMRLSKKRRRTTVRGGNCEAVRQLSSVRPLTPPNSAHGSSRRIKKPLRGASSITCHTDPPIGTDAGHAATFRKDLAQPEEIRCTLALQSTSRTSSTRLEQSGGVSALYWNLNFDGWRGAYFGGVGLLAGGVGLLAGGAGLLADGVGLLVAGLLPCLVSRFS